MIATYPAPTDYVRAVQQPAKVFASPELRAAEFAVDPLLGVPRPGVGSSAVVFKANVHGRTEALRFFTRDDASSRERYQALSRHIAAAGLGDCLATSSWYDDAITVNGRTWPLVRMEWIEGRPLDRYTESLVERDDTAALGGLAELWRTMVKRLQDAQFAHGDLQHGNVLVDQSSRLRLVDLDGCWVPSLAGGTPPSEHGHPNYQRPSRQWDRWMDTFPSLVVYLSLRALAKNPEPWDDLYAEDNLIFREGDFATPYDTDVWRRLDTLRDTEVAALARRLKACCDPGWSATGTLESLLGAAPSQRTGPPRWWESPSTTTSPVAPPLVTDAIKVKLPPPPRKTTVSRPFVPTPPPSAPGTPPWGTPPPVATPAASAPTGGNWWETNPTAAAAASTPTPGASSAGSTTPATPGKTGQNLAWAAFVALVVGGAGYVADNSGVAWIIAVIAAVVVWVLLTIIRQ